MLARQSTATPATTAGRPSALAIRSGRRAAATSGVAQQPENSSPEPRRQIPVRGPDP
jgi:hypothetical protein